MVSILDLIENKILDLNKIDHYAAILGETPSKGAKSPSLWNAAFKETGLSGMMHPLDVKPENLDSVVASLKTDKRFIGGAVTMPYKIDIIPFLDKIEPEAEAIGAVNCIYREGEKIVGSNTDGAGALWSLQNEIKEGLSGKTVLLTGTGGAGFAVAAYIASALGPAGKIILSNRSMQPCIELTKRLEGKCQIATIDWPVHQNTVTHIDILINCSSIGYEAIRTDKDGAYNLTMYTPLGMIDDKIRVSGQPDNKQYIIKASKTIADNIAQSLQFLASFDKLFVMDIIYQPRQTILLYLSKLLGHRTLNGTSMNLEQAVIAFDKTTDAVNMRKSNRCEVRDIMSKIW